VFVWFFTSEPSGISQKRCIVQLRERVKTLFEDNEWRVRFPKEPTDRVHMTIRDERYETRQAPGSVRITPQLPSSSGTMRLVFDKLAVTSAAEHIARHRFKRQFLWRNYLL